MTGKLKKEFLELLEKDLEFRYAVAGYLGLSEMLKRFDGLEEGQKKLWEEVGKLSEGQKKLWEEVRALSEGQKKLWEEVGKLSEGQKKLWEEVGKLSEGQKKLWEEVGKLSEGQKKLWEEVRALREDQRKLRASFESFGRALGVTLEDYTAGFVKIMLEDLGYPDRQVGRKALLSEGEIYEINVFCEEPLAVGEVTLYLGDRDDARRELEKLQRRVEVAEKATSRQAVLKILAVGNASSGALDYLKAVVAQQGVRLIYGRELIL